MKRYRLAVRWIAANDDNEWLREAELHQSITASLVADIFDKTPGQVRADLISELRHIHPNSWYGKMPWESA